ncbi:TPR-like protein, partial [Daedalea quercina L-15889]
QGNAAFKAGDYPAAVGHYSAAIVADPANATYPLNRAAAYLKLGKNGDVERDCERVLILDKNNVKAMFRRGQARVALQRLNEAKDGDAPSPPRKSVPSVTPASEAKVNGRLNRPPMTLFEFSREWDKREIVEDRWVLLNEVSPIALPSLFQSSLEARSLTNIVGTLRDVLKVHPEQNVQERIREYMIGLTRVQRFSTVVLFMSSEERKVVKETWQSLGGGEGERAWGVS